MQKIVTPTPRWRAAAALALTAAVVAACGGGSSDVAGGDEQPGAETTLTLVAYAVPEPGWSKIIPAFAATPAGKGVAVTTSYGASGDQSRAVVDGKPADIVNFSVEPDITRLVKAGKVAQDWNADATKGIPFGSVVTLVVRKGNPKNIKDWDDLVKPGMSVITPNPKTSGGARWNYLAAWGYALKHNGGDEAKAREFVTSLFKNVPVLDSGARGSTTTFVERGMGDVLIAWENEAFLAMEKLGQGKVEIVVPSISILAEPPVALVDKVADKHGTRDVATAYLEYLYSPEGQEIAARHYYRPSLKEVADKHADKFPKVTLLTIEGDFGGWEKAQRVHFADGGIFDQIYQPGN